MSGPDGRVGRARRATTEADANKGLGRDIEIDFHFNLRLCRFLGTARMQGLPHNQMCQSESRLWQGDCLITYPFVADIIEINQSECPSLLGY